MNRLDSIFWYVDGIERGSKKNYYWHKPMFVTVSMGLRTPYEEYINGIRTVVPHPESIPEPGFPTEMQCDFVRVYNTPAQIYADKEVYYEQSFSKDQDLVFKVLYFAGNGEVVTGDFWEGVSCFLQEVKADGEVVNELKMIDSAAVGKESGEAKLSFDIEGLTSSSLLAEGNQYVLRLVFRTTKNDGQNIYLKEEVYPITLLGTSGVNDPEALEEIQITSMLSTINIKIENLTGTAQISVVDMAGRTIYNRNHSDQTININTSNMTVSGMAIVSVQVDGKVRVAKVVLTGR